MLGRLSHTQTYKVTYYKGEDKVGGTLAYNKATRSFDLKNVDGRTIASAEGVAQLREKFSGLVIYNPAKVDIRKAERELAASI